MFLLSHVKNQFQEKNPVLPNEISVFCTTKECDDITTPYYPILALFFINGRLWEVKNKFKENCKLLAQKVVAVDYERWSLTSGSK